MASNLVAACVMLVQVSPAAAISLTVQNSSFETSTLAAHSPPAGTPDASWRFGCGSSNICGEAGILNLSDAPDGFQVAYTTGTTDVENSAGSLGQQIAPLVGGATYTFSIMVGQSETSALTGYRLNLGYNSIKGDPASNFQFASVLFNQPADIPDPGKWLLASITAVAPNNATGWLTISFGSQSYAMWDQASVAQTPLPAALPLFATGLGAMGLLAWRRKRKQQAAIGA